MAMDKFLVYCKLMRAGYIVQRCARMLQPSGVLQAQPSSEGA